MTLNTLPSKNENWAAVAPVYYHVERLTTPPCQILINRVSQILPLDNPTTTAFDNGCGTGVLTTVLKQQYPHIPIVASDYADGMIDILKTKIQLQNWTGVSAQVADSRNLASVKDDSFSHAFSSFMICLAPDPDKIVAEMHRVLKPDGVLGLAVWGKPDFGPFTAPWEKACRQVMPDYESPMLMGEKWTLATNVREGLVKAGFRDVVVWEEECEWAWDGAGEVASYFFDGGNPPNQRWIESFRERGGRVEDVRGVFERLVAEEWGVGSGGGGVVLMAPATLATARK